MDKPQRIKEDSPKFFGVMEYETPYLRPLLSHATFPSLNQVLK